MSYHVLFSFSVGLAKPILVPADTLKHCQAHVERVESALGLKREKHLDNPVHWRSTTPTKKVDDKTFCEIAQFHNRWVRSLYHWMELWFAATPEDPPKGAWYPQIHVAVGEDAARFDLHNYGKPAGKPDTMTPEDAATFWHGLQKIPVPAERWSADYYRDQMEHLYEVMRGRTSRGQSFDAAALTPKQAAAVVNIFSPFLDVGDQRLDVPNGHDYLASSSDGGYDWCEKCGPAHPDDSRGCTKNACPVRAEDDEREWVVKDKVAGVYLGKRIDDWPSKITRHVERFPSRHAAVEAAAKFTKRVLVPVPLREQY